MYHLINLNLKNKNICLVTKGSESTACGIKSLFFLFQPESERCYLTA